MPLTMTSIAEALRLLTEPAEPAAAPPPAAGDRRRAPRLKVRLTLDLHELDGERFLPPRPAYVRDVSAGGLGLTYSRPIPVGGRFACAVPTADGAGGGRPLLVQYEVRDSCPLWDGQVSINACRVETDAAGAGPDQPVDEPRAGRIVGTARRLLGSLAFRR